MALANRGLKVTLLESRPRLGGRASSFPDPASGDLVDNCQHVSMTCCTNLADFCARVGTRDLFRKVPSIVFLSPEGRRSTLRAGLLPAPLHLSGSFLAANYLTFAERLRVAWGLTCLRFARVDTAEPFASWLLRHGQTPRTIGRYWATVLVSALNERLDQMDVGHARKVFLDGFLRTRDSYVMEVPTVPLGELYGTRLEAWLSDHDVEVRLKTGVRSVEVEEGAVTGLQLRDGTRLDADFVILSAPFNRVLDLLGPSAEQMDALSHLTEFQSSPITGVHLWFDREVCPLDHAVIVDRSVQWVFNHSALQGRRDPASSGQYLQLVISAAYDLAPLSNEAILQIARDDLAAIWPESKDGAAPSLAGRHRARGDLRRPPRCRGASAPSAHVPSTAFFWPGTGPAPAGPPRWKARCAPATWPPRAC